VDRRTFLSGAAGGATLVATPSKTAQGAQGFDAPYPPVLSAPEREIRTVVGHRPYRRSGFVVRPEKFARTTIVHNYGHGGCGVTLSWGSAKLALAAAGSQNQERAAVIGAGVIGLTTALMLARRGVATTVYAEHLPPNTTSNIAAALWEPASLFRLEDATPEFLEQFRFAARASHDAFQHLANNPRYGVRWIRRLELADAPPEDPKEPIFEGADLYPGRATDRDPKRYFGFPYTERWHALMIDPDIYLNALMVDFAAAGGRIIERRFETVDDVLKLKERLIFNCAGLGAGALFGDEELKPVRGQLTMLLPQPEIDYGYVNFGPQGLLYMFPRSGAIVLGGSFDYDDSSTDINDAERARMIAGHAAIAAKADRRK
jgi:glycine/D-amino acid oxidase-like deaminating enzyme